MVTIPVIEEAPETAIFFGLVFISVNVTLMNVILAVIVDAALKASEEEEEAEKFDKAKKELGTLCRRIDADKSGDLTEEEVTSCFDNKEDFQDLLLSLDIKKENIHAASRRPSRTRPAPPGSPTTAARTAACPPRELSGDEDAAGENYEAGQVMLLLNERMRPYKTAAACLAWWSGPAPEPL